MPNHRKNAVKGNEKGFSLIEMVVVIAIMMVMTGAIVLSVSNLYSQQVKKACRTIDALLTDTKTLTMAKSSSQFKLLKDGDYYYAETTDGTKKQLSNNKTLTVKYKVKDGSSYIDVATNPIVIKYNKSSGAFKPLDTGEYVKEIVVSCGSRNMTIVLYPKTGKHEVKK